MHIPVRAIPFSLLIAGAAPLSAHDSVPNSLGSAALSPAARSAAATVDTFHSALRKGDANVTADLLADDAIIFEEGGAERSKAEYVARHLPADIEFSKAVASQVTRRTGNSNGVLAWIASEGRTTGAYHGRTIDQATTETMVLRRSGHQWKIVHIHWSSARR